MGNQAVMKVDYANLRQVKELAIDLSSEGTQFTVILRPGAVNYNIIHTSREKDLLRGALVVFRTGEDL